MLNKYITLATHTHTITVMCTDGRDREITITYNMRGDHVHSSKVISHPASSSHQQVNTIILSARSQFGADNRRISAWAQLY